ncbi:hypothetical protein HPB49_024694 [Dermacentor silvarum]|uniref:Uncharacterized protein n=1 Tax=Dermacentor silvarum TaxID=543639 RepID=A0ACB8CC61_DERSI|nr:hypothetical protein HPB49_024694 [Dermacentor silvarum]
MGKTSPLGRKIRSRCNRRYDPQHERSTEAENKENTAAWKAEDKKQRELFEKQFPEMKKKRESRERLLRGGNCMRSDAHMDEIIGGIQEQEKADRKMRLNAVVPPTLVDTQELRRPHYCDRSRLVLDPLAEYQERQMQSAWTDQEKEIFREKFVQHSKDFGKIASFLINKSTADCVHHYTT